MMSGTMMDNEVFIEMMLGVVGGHLDAEQNQDFSYEDLYLMINNVIIEQLYRNQWNQLYIRTRQRC